MCFRRDVAKHGVTAARTPCAAALSVTRFKTTGRHRSLLAMMAKKRRGRVNRVKGIASCGFFRRWKWIWIVLLVLLLIPALQVAVVRFVDPPRTVPMWIEQVSSSAAKAP